jgi:hypothetical protein
MAFTATRGAKWVVMYPKFSYEYSQTAFYSMMNAIDVHMHEIV